MAKKSQDLNKEIINVKEFSEKLTEDVKKNILRLVSGVIGSGFFCKIYFNNNNIMPALITCYHVLNVDHIKKKNIIYYSYYTSKGNAKAQIDLNIQRIIFQDKELDITIIEIKEEDNLDIYSFLEMDNSININSPKILNHKTYLLHYPKGVKDVQYSQGEIINLNDKFNFIANYWTEPGSSGSPIFDYEKNLVIGMHSKGSKIKENNNNIGLGIILKYAVIQFIKKKGEEINHFYKNLYPRADTMDMIYIIQENKPIHIFCGEFVKRYESKCNIKYNGEKYNLTEYFTVPNLSDKEKEKGEIKITLEGINYITNMSYMFSKCNNLKKVIATETDMSKVKYMELTFEWCSNLEELSNTSKWNLENVESLKGLFYECTKLKKVPGIGKWNPIKLKDCNEMFLACQSELDPSTIPEVLSWKNVNEEVKSGCKNGFGVKNFWSYYIFDNFGGTLEYFGNLINPNKNKE